MKTNSKGILAVGVFLIFGSITSLLAAYTVIFPGSIIDTIWSTKRDEFDTLLDIGKVIGFLFILLAIILSIAAYGWLRLTKWGWWLTVCIISLNVLSDAGKIFSGDFYGGIMGIILGGLLLLYLNHKSIKAKFFKHNNQA